MRCHCPRTETIVLGGLLAGSEPVGPENPDPEDPGGAHDPARDDVHGEEAVVPRVPSLPPEASARQIAEHENMYVQKLGVAIA